MSAKIALDYSKQTDAQFVTQTLGMVNGLTGNANFPLPWPTEFPTLAQLSTAQSEFATAVTLAADRDKAKVADKNAKRVILAGIVREIGRYLQTKSGGDRAILETTGYALAKTREPAPEIPDAPTDLKLKNSKVSGTIVATAKSPNGAGSIETWVCDGDPNVEANWRMATQTTSARSVEVSGLARGKDYYVRMRAIGKKGAGPWSNVEMIFVT